MRKLIGILRGAAEQDDPLSNKWLRTYLMKGAVKPIGKEQVIKT